MTEHVYFITLGMFFGTIVLVSGMRYENLRKQAKARLASEQGYRKLAEQVAAEQAAVLSALTRIERTLGEIAPRVSAVETMLNEVG